MQEFFLSLVDVSFLLFGVQATLKNNRNIAMFYRLSHLQKVRVVVFLLWGM
ncbi:hypothetical protein KC19_6G136900 [Ceratodon purpureus]|uniref:Uncharacterized protein n=1 Tax=Ceratodon purpureus TaxID=3225 RepID=A0A8T0HE45_CERPU|nr:hypothetical protein KC19_6G136900 [Ceratodon purpureus]